MPDVTLDEEAYEILETQREEGESASDVIRRLLGPGPPDSGSFREGVEADAGETMEDVAETAGDEDAEMDEA